MPTLSTETPFVSPPGGFIIYGSERITFTEFNARVNRLIHALGSWELRREMGSEFYPGTA